jgi:hypothetical protein
VTKKNKRKVETCFVNKQNPEINENRNMEHCIFTNILDSFYWDSCSLSPLHYNFRSYFRSILKFFDVFHQPTPTRNEQKKLSSNRHTQSELNGCNHLALELGQSQLDTQCCCNQTVTVHCMQLAVQNAFPSLITIKSQSSPGVCIESIVSPTCLHRHSLVFCK